MLPTSYMFSLCPDVARMATSAFFSLHANTGQISMKFGEVIPITNK